LQNDLKKANEYRAEVIKKGNLITEADKLAYQNANANTWPNLFLLKARILSDGGFQAQALNVLADKTSLDFSNEDDKAEFSYRLARIYDLMGDKDLAIKFYKSTMLKGKNLKQYYAARAALQIGLIYEDRKDFNNAIAFYKNSMEMKNTAFKNSLDQKAKSGILRCQK
jgi:tetratricopeptide (TPR) repeat protein